MKLSACRFCSGKLNPEPLISFSNMPAKSQNFPTKDSLEDDRAIDFNVFECLECSLIQLNSEPVPSHKDVIRATAYSPAMKEFRNVFFHEFIKKFTLDRKKILEIGCGHGEYLEIFSKLDVEVYGIENLKSSVDFCIAKGLRVNQNYPSDEGTKFENGPFDGFYCLNFLEHAPLPHLFLRSIRSNLTEDGVGLIEVPNLDYIIKNNIETEFMTDHLVYFSKETLIRTLEMSGFDVLSCDVIWNEYIISCVVKKRKLTKFPSLKANRDSISQDFQLFLNRFPKKSVVVWGAGHQALSAISIYNLSESISWVVDSAPFKQGKFTPATHLEVKAPESLMERNKVSAVIVMGAGYSDEIIDTLLKVLKLKIPIAVLRTSSLQVIQGKI